MARKTNAVLLSTDDNDLSAAELKRKNKLIQGQDEPEASKKTPPPPAAAEAKEKETITDVESESKEKETVLENTSTDEKESNIEEKKTNAEIDAETVNVEEKESTVNIVKKIRTGIDRVHTLCSKEFMPESEVTTAIFFGKSWLGKLLSFLDNSNPYANEDKIKNRKEIPATADTYSKKELESVIFQFNLKNRLDKVILIRKELQSLIDAVQSINIKKEEVSDVRLSSICKTNAYTKLSEAKFLLGNELAKLKI